MPRSTDILSKRMAVISAYGNERWQQKVNRMEDDQLIAVYLRLKGQNKI